MQPRPVPARWLLRATLLGLALLLLAHGCQPSASCSPQDTASVPAAGSALADDRTSVSAAAEGYVGSAACQPCHAGIHAEWLRSTHFHNMAPASSASVIGDFERRNQYAFQGTRSRMTRQGERFFMEYTDPTGQAATWSVDYALGIDRHQVYLHRFPDGRLQMLPTYWQVDEGAWRDAREGSVTGGPQPLPTHHHAYWQNFSRTFNRACAECHSSQPRKQFDAATASYASTFDPPINCEACHGPGAAHVRARATGGPDPEQGLVRFHQLSAEAGIELCASCHARKRIYREGFIPGAPMADYFIPDVWEQDWFFVDGRSASIGTYEYAGYLQSTCWRRASEKLDCNGRCHAPHGPRPPGPRAVVEQNSQCTYCHVRHGAALTEHTFHLADSRGSVCIECHMPEVPLPGMALRDHTIGSPLPELTVRYQIPNGCNTCHTDDSPAWADQAVQRWYGHLPTFQQYRKRLLERAETLSRVWARDPDHPAPPDPALAAILIRWLDDPAETVIARASAAKFLSEFKELPQVVEALLRQRHASHPVIRYHVLGALEQAPGGRTALEQALTDRYRSIRVLAYEALRATGPVPSAPAATRAREEHRHWVEAVRADDPKPLSGWALQAFQQGRLAEAEQLLRQAVRLADPVLEPRLHLFQFLLAQRRLPEAEEQARIIEQRHAAGPEAAIVRAQLLLNQGRSAEAVRILQEVRQRGVEGAALRRFLDQALRQLGQDGRSQP